MQERLLCPFLSCTTSQDSGRTNLHLCCDDINCQRFSTVNCILPPLSELSRRTKSGTFHCYEYSTRGKCIRQVWLLAGLPFQSIHSVFCRRNISDVIQQILEKVQRVGPKLQCQQKISCGGADLIFDVFFPDFSNRICLLQFFSCWLRCNWNPTLCTFPHII